MAAILALRVVYACVYRVDSDEPQHMHVVWGWAHGLLQYRDLFDNHSPLFQMLCAPLLWAIGEHAWIMVPMRLAMIPLFVADLWFVFLIGRALYNQRWGLWTAVVAGCVPQFFLMTTEFRTDDLWATLWLGALCLAVTGPLIGRRAFWFGLLMGACVSTTMKTALLLGSLAIGAAGLLALNALSRRRFGLLKMLKSGGLIIAGMVIIPALLVGFFAAHGALHQMYYCVVQHNAVPGLGKWAKAGDHLWLFPLSLPVLLGLGWLCMHSSADHAIGAGRALVLMTWGSYYFLLRSYWPLVTGQDAIPMLPLAALTLVPFLFHLLSLTGWPARVFVPAAGALLVAAGFALICRAQSPMDNEMAPFVHELGVALRITNPNDLVMDGKGETIFRNRPVYWVYEGVTLRRMARGDIPDDIRAQMIAKSVCVAFDHRLRPEDQEWFVSNYVEGDGKVWVAGQQLGSARPAIRFHTDIKAAYSLVSTGGKLTGSLDGAPIQDSQVITPGDHHLQITGGSGEVAVIWTQALERGFNPFTKHPAALTD
jgi:hypothetical protein